MSTAPETNPSGRTPDPSDRMLARQHEAYGGMKLGSGFFGWLVATGAAVLLLAIAAAAGIGVGAGTTTGAEDAADQATQNIQSLATVGGVVLLVILFVAYFCGGYVAGRMARFDGAKQGLAVWLWALIFAVVVGVLAAILGSRFDVGAQLESLGLPVTLSEITTTGIIALVIIAVVTLLAAVLGGKVGMAYHRKVDRAGRTA